MISIVDYGSGNIDALATLVKRANVDFSIINSPEDIKKARRIIVPGVGAFDHTMSELNNSGMSAAIIDHVQSSEVSCLGICVGMHIMANSSEEGTEHGLGLIPGSVRRFDEKQIASKPKVPHMGWNSIKSPTEHPLLTNVDLEKGFYFLHSYYYDCKDTADVVATTSHGNEFHSIVGSGRVFGVQFHPEKSHQNGIRLIENFLNL